MVDRRPIAIVTGACGGMGQACARSLGIDHRLVLGDIDAGKMSDFASRLVGEGHDVVAALHGNIADRATCSRLVAAAVQAGRLGTVVHAAGLSASTGSWDAIINTNLIGTEFLLQEVEGTAASGYTAVVIASMAGHLHPSDPELDALFDQPLEGGLLNRAQAMLGRHVAPGDTIGIGAPAYSFTKAANIRMVQARSIAWAGRGNRILSVSPGTIRTPMGLTEAEKNPAAQAVVDATPMGRWGNVIDIANLVQFLASDRATFITGTDVLIDGGVTAALRRGILTS